jgi:hypothetical protein
MNLASHLQTVLATGGSRGGPITVDATDGSLLITQADRIVRLNLSPEQPATQTVPEPAPILIWAGIAACILLARVVKLLSGMATI